MSKITFISFTSFKKVNDSFSSDSFRSYLFLENFNVANSKPYRIKLNQIQLS